MDDSISRQAAIEEIARWIGYIDEDMVLRIQTGLKKVPSAQRTGRWEKYRQESCLWHCSACGDSVIAMPERMGKPLYDYCPNCGAKMTKGEETE